MVEDEKDIRNFLKISLEAECFAVDAADDGQKGWDLAKKNDYDLMILDNVLPYKTGLEICRDVRGLNKTMPIIMLSVKSEVSTKVDLLNAGSDDYLVKPFSFQELLARIRANLRRPKNVENEILQIDDLVLDTKKHTVRRGDKRINLTRKEFTLLEYLMRNQGTVLSRAMILEHVWDMNTDLFSNTIESHIASLRRKVDLADTQKLIHTASGLGYKMDMHT